MTKRSSAIDSLFGARARLYGGRRGCLSSYSHKPLLAGGISLSRQADIIGAKSMHYKAIEIIKIDRTDDYGKVYYFRKANVA